MTGMELLERLMYKITSGRFIMTMAAAVVFAYMSITGTLKEDRIMEVLLIVIYAYFSIQRTDNNGNPTGQVGTPPDKTTTTTTTLPPK